MDEKLREILDRLLGATREIYELDWESQPFDDLTRLMKLRDELIARLEAVEKKDPAAVALLEQILVLDQANMDKFRLIRNQAREALEQLGKLRRTFNAYNRESRAEASSVVFDVKR